MLGEITHHPLDIVAHFGTGDLVLPQFSAEVAVQAQAAAQMDLEALGTPAVAVLDHLALEPDVGDLNAGARVRAAVDVDRDRYVECCVEVGQALFEFGNEYLGTLAGFGEGQLAELDSAAGHQVSPPVRRCRRQAQCIQAGDQFIEPVVGHVQDDQLLVRGEPDAVRADSLGEVGDRGQDGARHPAGDRGDANGVEPVAQSLYPDVVDGANHRFGCRAVDQRPLQVFRFQNLPEFLDTPVLDEELQSRLGPKPAIAIVAEEADDRLPDLGYLVEWHPGTDPLGQHRVGRQSAADPQVQAGAVLGMVHPDEGDVVDLVHDILQTADGGLELSRQVRILRLADVAAHDLLDRRRRIDDLIEGLTGQRRAEHHPRAVPARLGGLQSDGVESPPDLRHILDPDPVVLHVLPVGDIGGVAGELGGDCAQGAQRRGGQHAAVAADPQHEIGRLEQIDVLIAGERAVVTLNPLGVETPPAEPAAQVDLVDTVESVPGVDGLNPFPHIERGVILLQLLVGVERLPVPEGPLALATLLRRVSRVGGRRWIGCRHGMLLGSGEPVVESRRSPGGNIRWRRSGNQRVRRAYGSKAGQQQRRTGVIPSAADMVVIVPRPRRCP